MQPIRRTPRQIILTAVELLRARWYLRHCNALGARPRLMGNIQVNNQGTLRIGERVQLRGTHLPIELATLPGASLVLGDSVFINAGTSICAQQSITIGDNCAIGNLALIMDTDFHAIDDHRQPPLCAPVIIENDVWIGARVTILKGVTIGRGAVVAAGAVVTRDVPPRTLVAGVPARILRTLPPLADSSVMDNAMTAPITEAAH